MSKSDGQKRGISPRKKVVLGWGVESAVKKKKEGKVSDRVTYRLVAWLGNYLSLIEIINKKEGKKGSGKIGEGGRKLHLEGEREGVNKIGKRLYKHLGD